MNTITKAATTLHYVHSAVALFLMQLEAGNARPAKISIRPRLDIGTRGDAAVEKLMQVEVVFYAESDLARAVSIFSDRRSPRSFVLQGVEFDLMMSEQ